MSTAGAATAQADANRSATQQAIDATEQTGRATLQAAQARAQLTMVAAEAERVSLAAERERNTQSLKTWGGWVAAGAIFLTAILAFWLWSRVRVIPRDARGDAQPVIINGKYIDMDRVAASGIDLRTGMPLLMAPDIDTLRNVLMRDQAIDLVTRALPGGQSSKPEERIQAVALLNGGVPALPKLEIDEVVDGEADEASRKLVGGL
jgi:hypothetical protein